MLFANGVPASALMISQAFSICCSLTSRCVTNRIACVPIAKQLTGNEQTIVAELNSVQGQPAELGGYYRPDKALTSRVMRPSSTLNAIIDSL